MSTIELGFQTTSPSSNPFITGALSTLKKYNPFNLTGRVCSNWRESLNIAIIAAQVAAFFMAFLSGNFLMMVITASTAGYNLLMRQEYRRLRQMELAFLDLKGTNLDLRFSAKGIQLQNRILEKNCAQFSKQIVQNEHLNKEYQQQNTILQTTNQQLAKEVDNLKIHLTSLLACVQQTEATCTKLTKNLSENGGNIVDEVTKANRELQQNISKCTTMREELNKQLTTSKDDFLEFLKAIQQNQNITNDSMRALFALNQEILKSKTELTQTTTLLHRHLAEYEKLKGNLETAEQKLQETLRQLEIEQELLRIETAENRKSQRALRESKSGLDLSTVEFYQIAQPVPQSASTLDSIFNNEVV